MMKKVFSKMILFCVTAMLLSSGALQAQEQTIRLGYCETATGSPLVPSGEPEACEVGAAIYLPASLLKKYKGNKINRVDFAIMNRVGNVMTVFVTKELGGTPIVSRNISEFQAGWNSVELPKSVSITGTEDLYVGYVYYTDIENYSTPVIWFDSPSGGNDGVNWYSKDNSWYVTKANVIDYNVCIRAYATGTNVPLNDVGISDLSGNGIVRQNSPEKFKALIRNYGLDTVNKLTIEAKANGQVFATKTIDNLNVGHNEKYKFEIQDVEFPTEGNSTIEVNVIQVNDNSDNDLTDNATSIPIYCIRPEAKAVARTVLFEEFTSERTNDGVLSNELYRDVLALYPNLKHVWVKHHVKDKFALPEEEVYGYFFQKGSPFYPSVMVDRNVFEGLEDRGPGYFVTRGDVFEAMLLVSESMLCFVTPVVQVDYNKDLNKMDIKVDVNSEVKEMIGQKDLRLTVYAVEDNVYSVTQTGEMEYHHNGIIRKVLTTSGWGDPIDLNEYTVTKNYTLDVDPTWKPENMRIVAFVSNYDNTKYDKCMVYNATQTSVGTTMNIDNTLLSDGKTVPVVAYMGNSVWVEGGYKILGVYGMDGKSHGMSNLASGLYVVKVTDGTHTHNVKLRINNR